MKKPSSLAQQVAQAQRTVNSWSAAEKSSVRLEGSSSTSARFSSRGPTPGLQKAQSKK